MTLNSDYFFDMSQHLYGLLQADEHASLSLYGEKSDFIRFSNTLIRQSTALSQGSVTLTLFTKGKSFSAEFPLLFHESIQQTLGDYLAHARSVIADLPMDPFFVPPQSTSKSDIKNDSTPIDVHDLSLSILTGLKPFDAAGLITSGVQYCGFTNSLGAQHWWQQPSFWVDFSCYAPNQKAVKWQDSGQLFNLEAFLEKIPTIEYQLSKLSLPVKKLPSGGYRTYLEPKATSDLLNLLGYYLGIAAYKQGYSPMRKLIEQEQCLNPKVNIAEDFSHGKIPAFNEKGQLAPLHLPIIEQGKWANFLVSERSGEEFKAISNAANGHESMRSLHMLGGSLKESPMKALDTGLYIQNIHYLNWSDLQDARVTGMTRYACFWVEHGQIQAPIEDMRFDDLYYNILGDSLEALTHPSEFCPDMGSYEQRHIGGNHAPGLLLKNLTFTL